MTPEEMERLVEEVAAEAVREFESKKASAQNFVWGHDIVDGRYTRRYIREDAWSNDFSMIDYPKNDIGQSLKKLHATRLGVARAGLAEIRAAAERNFKLHASHSERVIEMGKGLSISTQNTNLHQLVKTAENEASLKMMLPTINIASMAGVEDAEGLLPRDIAILRGFSWEMVKMLSPK